MSAQPTPDHITEALDAARDLIKHGVPVFLAEPVLDAAGQWDPHAHGPGIVGGYRLPKAWQRTEVDLAVLDRWRPGMALCAVMGHVVDTIDVDPRSGGAESYAHLKAAGMVPQILGQQATPSDGGHALVRSLGVRSKDNVMPGMDFKAGVNGEGHGFTFLAPTQKVSKVTGEVGAYRWTVAPNLEELDPADDSGLALKARIEALRSGGSPVVPLEDIEPGGTPAATPYANLSPEQQQRADRYRDRALEGVLSRLNALMAVPYEQGPKYWDKTSHDEFCNLIELARTPALNLTLKQAHALAMEHGPHDSKWDGRAAKWAAAIETVRKNKGWRHNALGEQPTGSIFDASALAAPVTLGTLGERAVEADALQWADVETEDAPAEIGSTWRPLDLAETVRGLRDGTIERLAPTVGVLSNDGALFYAGKVNGVAGASNSGKSWTALLSATQALADGEHVVYVDLEDDAAGIVERLQALGAPDGALVAQFHYVHPDEAYGAAAAAQLTALVERVAPVLVVIDSTGESLALDGAKPNDDDDVARWFRRLPTRIARLGPAVVVLDHVVKADEGGLWPIGSQRKRAAISGAQYMQTVVSPFDRETDGFSKIVCAKDRHGNYRQGLKVAELHIAPKSDGPYATLRATGSADTSAGPFRPTHLMERASEALHGSLSAPLTTNAWADRVSGKRKTVLEAIDLLVSEGYVKRETGGPRGANLFTSVRPYSQTDDRQSDRYSGGELVEAHEGPKTGSTGSGSLDGEPGTSRLTGSGNQSGTSGNQWEPERISCPCGEPLIAPESIEAGACGRCRIDREAS